MLTSVAAGSVDSFLCGLAEADAANRPARSTATPTTAGAIPERAALGMPCLRFTPVSFQNRELREARQWNRTIPLDEATFDAAPRRQSKLRRVVSPASRIGSPILSVLPL